jgi:hypothetical protein
MGYAVNEKSPVFGDRVVSATLETLKRLLGLRDALIVRGPESDAAIKMGLPDGVANIIDRWSDAHKAPSRRRVPWSPQGVSRQSPPGFERQATELAQSAPHSVIRREGNLDAACARLREGRQRTGLNRSGHAPETTPSPCECRAVQ